MMNFLVIGKFYTEGFAEHIAETLTDMGHVVYKYEPGRKYMSSNNKYIATALKVMAGLKELYMESPTYQKMEEYKLRDFCKNKGIDIAIVCHDFLTPTQVGALKEFCKKVVLWFPDAIVNLKKAMCIVSSFDFLFFKDKYIIDILKKEYGITQAYYLPECANIKYLKPITLSSEEKKKYSCDIGFAGNLHSFRVSLLRQLKDYDVKVWGNRVPFWMDTTGIDRMIMNYFVANEDKAKAFLGAKININSLHPGEIAGVNVRTFEIAACGAFQICNYRTVLSELYIPDDEIVTYFNIEELKEKIDYYLNNRDKCEEIGRRAFLRTVGQHTYQHRLNTIISHCNI